MTAPGPSHRLPPWIGSLRRYRFSRGDAIGFLTRLSGLLALVFLVADIHPAIASGPREVAGSELTNHPGALVDWSMFRFVARHSGHNKRETVLSPVNIGELEVSWAGDVRGAISASSPAVVDGTVYIGTGFGLQAFSERTGQRLWIAPEYGGSSSPAVAFGLVFVMGDHAVWAFDQENGDLVWSEGISITGDTSSPTVANGLVYVGGDRLQALEPTTGDTVWAAEIGSGGIYESPAVVDGVVYSMGGAAGAGRFYAVDALTGSIVWRSDSLKALPDSSPAVVGDQVFVGATAGFAGYAYSLRRDTGEIVWRVALAGPAASSPAVAYGTVYVGAFDHGLYALDAETGEVQWTVPSGGVYSSPAVGNGVVYFASDDESVYAVDAQEGNVLWTYATGAPVSSSPTVVNGRLLVGSGFNLFSFGLPSD